MEKMEREQRMLGVLLIIVGLLTVPYFGINGAGILLVLMGIARAVFGDE